VKRPTRGQKYESVRLAGQLRAQAETISAIHTSIGYRDKLIDQPNVAGKTPRQLLEETRTKWEEAELTISRSKWKSDA
jgi:hypothetical protein